MLKILVARPNKTEKLKIQVVGTIAIHPKQSERTIAAAVRRSINST